MIGISIANSLGLQYGSGLDPAAQAFINATGITGEIEKQAINSLVTDLKAYNLWSKMKAVYPFVTDNRNLLSYTEDFSNSIYWLGPLSVTLNAGLDPNGGNTANALIEGNKADSYVKSSTFSVNLSANKYEFSVYAKKATRDWVQMYMNDGLVTRYCWFNVNTGTIGTVQSGALASIEHVGNGWYRCSMNMTMSASGNNFGFGPSSGNGISNYMGNSSIGIYSWGSQLEFESLTTYQPIATTQQAFIANQFKYNLVNPVDSDAAFRLVFNGGWTHSANGATPNGTNGYADTKLVPSSVLALNNTHLSYYSRTNNSTNSAEIGAGLGVSQSQIIINFSNVSYDAINNTPAGTTRTWNTDGNFIVSRTANNLYKSYKNNTTIATYTTASTTSTNLNIYLGARNIGTADIFTNRQSAFASIGDGLTDTEAANFYTAVQAYQTALSRQV